MEYQRLTKNLKEFLILFGIFISIVLATFSSKNNIKLKEIILEKDRKIDSMYSKLDSLSLENDMYMCLSEKLSREIDSLDERRNDITSNYNEKISSVASYNAVELEMFISDRYNSPNK